MRRRSASNRLSNVGSGHQGPSVSMACVSSISPVVAASVGSRGTWTPAEVVNKQFSPEGYVPFGASPRQGGLGPYVVNGPLAAASQSDLPGISIGGCGSPKYLNSSLTTLSTTGSSVR